MKDLKIEKNEINFKSNKILKILRYRKNKLSNTSKI